MDELDDPWAGDVPTRPKAVVDPVWNRRTPPGPASPVGGGMIESPADAPEDGDGSTPPDLIDSPPDPSRRRWALIGAAVVVGAIALVAVVGNAGDDAPVGAPDPSAPESSTDTTDTTDTTVPPADTEPSAVSTPESDAPPTAADGGWTRSRLNLPSAVRTLTEPTEVILLTDANELRSLDLPSGIIRTLDLDDIADGRGGGGGDVVVGQSMIAIRQWGDEDTVTLVAPGGVPLTVPIDGSVQVITARPGTDEFHVLVADPDDGTLRETVVEADGTQRSVPVADIESDPWQRTYSPAGDLLVTDAGGLYAVDTEGTSTRVTTGRLVASGPNHILVRECDERRVCATVLIDRTGARTTLDENLTDSDVVPTYSQARLDPGGTGMILLDYRAEPTVRYVDFADGASVVLDTSGYGVAPAWTADGRGIVAVTDDGLRFVDRSTGLDFQIDDIDEQIVSLATRPVRPRAVVAYEPSVASGLRIVGLGGSGGVYDIEIDTGSVVRYDTPNLDSAAPATIVAAGGTVSVESYDLVAGFELDTETGDVSLTAGDQIVGPAYRGPTASTLWISEQPIGQPGVRFALRDVRGERIGPTIEIADATVIGSDGAGGLVVEGPGGVYVARMAEQPVRLTTGDVLAIGPTAAFVRECDVALVCGEYRVDRFSGERTPIDNPQLRAALVDEGLVGLTGTTVSPDGQVVAVRSELDGDPGWVMIDLADGSASKVPGLGGSSPVIWSDDSAASVYLSGDHLRIFDRADGSVADLTDALELPRIRTITRAAT